MHAGTCLVSELFILWLSLQRVKVLLFEKNIYYWKVFLPVDGGRLYVAG